MAQSCDPTTLATEATCINCNIPPGMYLPVLIYLFCQIASTGVGGGGGVIAGNYAGVQPNFTPTTTAAIAFDTSNGTQWNWYNNQWN